MTKYKYIEVTPIATAIGAEISGVDISIDVPEPVISEIRQALLEYLVIFFRDQDLSDPEHHRSFSKRFGQLFVHPNFNMGQKDPEMVFITRKPGDTAIVGETWHADTTMMKAPPMAAILYALEAPTCGGDTLFANQYLAYESLSEGMKKMLNGLKAVHNDSKVAGPKVGFNSKRSTIVREDDAWQLTENAHPVVRTHPETKRKGLFINSTYVQHLEGMTVEESEPILTYLYEHATRPEFSCRFRWRSGSVAFWDNRCVQHLAINDVQNSVRRMQRTQLVGDLVQ